MEKQILGAIAALDALAESFPNCTIEPGENRTYICSRWEDCEALYNELAKWFPVQRHTLDPTIPFRIFKDDAYFFPKFHITAKEDQILVLDPCQNPYIGDVASHAFRQWTLLPNPKPRLIIWQKKRHTPGKDYLYCDTDAAWIQRVDRNGEWDKPLS